MLKLTKAALIYGNSRYPVERTDDAPIPDFDFNNIDATIEKTMAVLSNQSGGHELNSARVQYLNDGSYARLYGNGFTVTWGETTPFPGGLPIGELTKLIEAREKVTTTRDVEFGIVTDQYGEGYKRARKTPWKQLKI